MRAKRTPSWRAKLAAMLVVFSTGPLLVLAFWEYAILVKTYESSTTANLKALARAKAEAIDQFTELRRRDVERMAGLVSPHVVALQAAEAKARPAPTPPEPLPELEDAEELAPDATVDTAAEEDDSSDPGSQAVVPKRPGLTNDATRKAHAALKRTLSLVSWDQKDFEELLVINPQGEVIAATFADHEGRTAENLDYFQGGRKATYVQPVFISPITKQLTMVISSPIRDADFGEAGVIAARLNLKRFFRLINDTTGLGHTGETVVAKKIGDEISLMAPTRHDAQAALQRTVPLGSNHAVALQEAALGHADAAEQTDYRGVRTFAAWQFVPSLEWGLLVKLDRAEVMAPVAGARERILGLTLIMLLLIIPASLFAAQALVRPLRELKRATDRISRGDLGVQMNIRSHDEIGELTDSFERMVAAIKFFREKSRSPDGERLEVDELEHIGAAGSPAAGSAREG